MPLNDYINQETSYVNRIQSAISDMEREIDEKIRKAVPECLNHGAKQFYDDICKNIASILSSGTTRVAEGSIRIPEYSLLNYDLEKWIKSLSKPDGIRREDRDIIDNMMNEKIKSLPFVYRQVCDSYDDYHGVSGLELWTKKTNFWSEARKAVLFGSYWPQFWDILCYMARSDGIQISYSIEVRETVKDKKTGDYSYIFLRSAREGEYVKCAYYSDVNALKRLMGQRPITIDPIVRYRYQG